MPSANLEDNTTKISQANQNNWFTIIGNLMLVCYMAAAVYCLKIEKTYTRDKCETTTIKCIFILSPPKTWAIKLLNLKERDIQKLHLRN